MKSRTLSPLVLALSALGAAVWLGVAAPEISGLQRQPTGDAVLQTTATTGEYYRIDTTRDMITWTPLVTLRSAGSDSLTDPGAACQDRRYYRTVALAGTGHITGDHLPTTNGDAILHPIGHASVLVTWNGKALYSDPSDLNNNGPRFAGLPLADVIVVTHVHGDHFATSRLNLLVKADTAIFAPQAVFSMMPMTNVPGQTFTLRSRTTVLANGDNGSAHGMTVRAIAMYNLSNNNHPQGVGNGYVVTLGGKNVYFSGDTEDIPEMRALTNIDAAFVCMSLPSNMTVDAAASAVREFKPKMVFPYHYRQSPTTFDIARFKTLVGTNDCVEVRLRSFY